MAVGDPQLGRWVNKLPFLRPRRAPLPYSLLVPAKSSRYRATFRGLDLEIHKKGTECFNSIPFL
jgi:hypothetical protein